MNIGFGSDSQLSSDAIERYSAHLLLPELTAARYCGVLEKRILVVGAGGLGSTCLLFLAAQGCKTLGIVDGDCISLSNLARQIIYTSEDVGKKKVDIAQQRCQNLNSLVRVEKHESYINMQNAHDILEGYDIVCDCTDNLPARLLLSDWCCALEKPLVSAAALRWEGHVTVFNYSFCNNTSFSQNRCIFHKSGCYRCFYTSSQLPSECQSCSEAGIVGGVVGMLGSLQAIETLKVATHMVNGECSCSHESCGKISTSGGPMVLAGHMYYYNALRGISRVFTLAPRNPSCAVCGPGGVAQSVHATQQLQSFSTTAALRETTLKLTKINLEKTCSTDSVCKKLESGDGISAKDLAKRMFARKNEQSIQKCILLDVREPAEVSMCRLPETSEGYISSFIPMYIPVGSIGEQMKKVIDTQAQNSNANIYVLCRRGIRSNTVVLTLRSKYGITNVFNVIGGLHAWRREVDPSFPYY